MSRIMIVGDAQLHPQNLFCTLSQQGYEVESLATPSEALASLRESPADLVIAEEKMPQMTGPELASLILENTPKCHAILMSAEKKQLPGHRLMFDWRPYELVSDRIELSDLVSIVSRSLQP